MKNVELLDIIQDSFPIAERPYAELARMIRRETSDERRESLSEQDVFETVERLRASGVIRRIGGVYDSRKLGYISRLCAGKVPTNELDFSEPHGGRAPTAMETFAAAVKKIPAITHNYVRSHEYNVWFTVIAESEHEVSAIIDRLCAETALHDVHAMAAKRMFKINTVMKSAAPTVGSRPLKVDSDAPTSGVSQSTMGSLVPHTSNIEARRATSYLIPDTDKLRIRLLSGDIPHSLTPFTDLCDQCGCGLEEFLDGAREDLAACRMRRFGAVLRHQEAGFAHNAMVCFLVDSKQWLVNSDNDGASREGGGDDNERGLDLIAEAGAILAANPHVSHCYEREPFEGFPYNVYAMFHASSREELNDFIAGTVQSVSKILASLAFFDKQPDILQYRVLHTVRELKKTSFQFF